MLGSLRFRLPALFLLGIVLAGVVATLIAVRFFQSNTRTHAASELRAESAGIVQLYEQQAGIGHVSVANLKLALGGNEVFWVPPARGASLLVGPLPQLPSSVLPAPSGNEKPAAFDFQHGGTAFLGVAQPVRLVSIPTGVLIVAEPESALRSRWRSRSGSEFPSPASSSSTSHAGSHGRWRCSPPRRTRSPPDTTTSPCRSAPGEARSNVSPRASTR